MAENENDETEARISSLDVDSTVTPKRRLGLRGQAYASVEAHTNPVDGGDSRKCIKILSVISIALLVDVLILLVYIFYGSPSTAPGASSGMNGKEDSVRLMDTSSDDISTWGIEWLPLPPPSKTISKIAFGSCSFQVMPQSYWDTVQVQSPDLVLLMGDNVYGDCHAESCELLRQAYRDWANLPSFEGAARSLSIIAVPDDHDYGMSDAWSINPHKDVAKKMFLDFFDIHDVRRSRAGDGLYQHFEYGTGNDILQIIVLDVRYARSEFLSSGDETNTVDSGPYTPDLNATDKQMLSSQQWEWLEKEVLPIPARVRLVISTVQTLNQKEGFGFEMWRMIPRELDRLRNLFSVQANKSLNIILSGDRHVGGFYRYIHENGHTLHEVTASSWTHTIPFGAYYECNSSEECDEKDSARVGDFVRENHFGLAEIDWPNNQITVSLRRTDTSPHRPYSAEAKHYHGRDRRTDAGHVLQQQIYNIP